MPPRLRLILLERLRDADKLVHRHLSQAIVVHNSTAPGLLVVDDVAARSLGLVFTVDTVAQVDGRVRAKGGQDLCRGGGLATGKYRDEVGVETERWC